MVKMEPYADGSITPLGKLEETNACRIIEQLMHEKKSHSYQYCLS